MALEITCPSSEAAFGAGRVGPPARYRGEKARELRPGRTGSSSVMGNAIAALLTRMGAHASVLAWEESRVRREVRANRRPGWPNFDDANLAASARAPVAGRCTCRSRAGDPRRRGARPS
jgi:DNA-binding protein WhiA